MRAVSNTSPLIALAKVEELKIFHALFDTLAIPQAVYDEFLTHCPPQESKVFHEAHFIKVLPVHTLIPCQRHLGSGEHAALSLAIQEKAEILVIDDRKALNEAIEQGLFAVSTRAILKIAEERGLIKSYEEIASRLRDTRFFLTTY